MQFLMLVIYSENLMYIVNNNIPCNIKNCVCLCIDKNVVLEKTT